MGSLVLSFLIYKMYVIQGCCIKGLHTKSSNLAQYLTQIFSLCSLFFSFYKRI